LSALARGSQVLNGWTAALDLHEDKDNFVVNADLPGMKREDIEVSLHECSLSISGERKSEEKHKDADVYRAEKTKDGYVVEAEMPGVNKDGLEVTLERNEITLVGHRKNEVVSGTRLLRERNLADYRRVFELDPAIDTGKVFAKIEQGVLTSHCRSPSRSSRGRSRWNKQINKE
jgi:HSP20 family molecular chaperone IbpA